MLSAVEELDVRRVFRNGIGDWCAYVDTPEGGIHTEVFDHHPKRCAAVRAAELLGKELGMFVDHRHLDVSFEQQVARYREIEGQASEVTPDESEDQGK
jgi:hypothetical protein